LLRAAQQLQLLVQEYPNDSEAHRVLGYVCLQLGQYDRAVMESKQALQLEPDNNVSAANLIEAYISLNKFDEAQDVTQ
jgi:Flp pilus assembly protein TadD